MTVFSVLHKKCLKQLEIVQLWTLALSHLSPYPLSVQYLIVVQCFPASGAKKVSLHLNYI